MRSAQRLVTTCSGGWPWRALLALALGLIAFSLIGMHQLSAGHAFATPPADAHHSHATGDHREHVGSGPHASVAHLDPATAHHAPALVAPGLDPPAEHDAGACPGCGGHTVPIGSCLLALTLLVLAWWLAPPRTRLALWARWRAAPKPALAGRCVPSLSLAELSVLRT